MDASLGNTGGQVPGDIFALLQMASKTGGGTSSRSRKGLDPQKVKQDIMRALADPTLSKDLVSMADEILEKKRIRQSSGGPGGGMNQRNLVRLNAKAMGFWKEYERQKSLHLS